MSKFRFVVCIDIEAPTLKEAYNIMSQKVIVGDAPGVVGWETSDEWFDFEDADDAGDPEILQSAIVESMTDRGLFSDLKKNDPPVVG